MNSFVQLSPPTDCIGLKISLTKKQKTKLIDCFKLLVFRGLLNLFFLNIKKEYLQKYKLITIKFTYVIIFMRFYHVSNCTSCFGVSKAPLRALR